eukprot:GHRR01005241.1.p1 GENE.GHRR01005241.1~~GHRR01005241.1.p1  ORF type:complete len:183 (+),score=44.12 GHRR01005241.1:368-916(+)
MLVDTDSTLDSGSKQQVYRTKQAEHNKLSDEDAAVDVSSVITQVTATTPSAAPAKWQVQQIQQQRAGWRHHVRNLLCCFAPPTPGVYNKQDVQLANSVYHTLPPQPPRVFREAVIGAKNPEDVHKKTLVLDLDETLVHSSFKPIPNPDYIIPVEIDGRLVDVYVLKRPWLDHFMSTVCSRAC